MSSRSTITIKQSVRSGCIFDCGGMPELNRLSYDTAKSILANNGWSLISWQENMYHGVRYYTFERVN